jgi:hypothetical protein
MLYLSHQIATKWVSHCGATQLHMPDEPLGGYWWLLRKLSIGEGPEETTDGHIAHAQAGFLLGAELSTFLAKKKSGDEAHLDFPE